MSPSPRGSYSAIMDGPDHIERPSSEAPTMQYGPHEVNQGEMSVDTPSNAFNHARHADQEISPGEENVLRSDIGVNTLLLRLKQSIASVKEFSALLKRRSTLEEEHAQGLKKLCRSSQEATRRPELRQGTYAQNYIEVTRIYDRMADNGVQFALNLHQMHEDLHELAGRMESGRKHWKQTGLSAEKRLQDSEASMEKAKAKYNSLAEDYDRARTGDKGSGRVFGLKGPKSAAQHEEDLHRKVQAADAEYHSKVQTAQQQRQDVTSSQRPQTIRALQYLINECDSGLTLQLQKFALSNEKLLFSNGVCVSPLSDSDSPESRSLRDVVSQIDNKRDLSNYISSFAGKVDTKDAELRYERHHTLGPMPSQQPPAIYSGQPSGSHQQYQQTPMPPPSSITSGPTYMQFPDQVHAPPPTFPSASSESREGMPTGTLQQQSAFTSLGSAAPPQIPAHEPTGHLYSASSTPISSTLQNGPAADLPAARPVFGQSLDDLLQRDGVAVPFVVAQCIAAVSMFGLDIEGIYRVSGSANHLARLKQLFDHDASQVNFNNPENFYHDVNSVASLLKQFFRELPDPLLTQEHYADFITAAKVEDDVQRRDSLHQVINALPDPNYATLRALTLHLHRVQEHSPNNRMNAGNLAICFGPTLMGEHVGPSIHDNSLQVRVIETILANTHDIFDDDE